MYTHNNKMNALQTHLYQHPFYDTRVATFHTEIFTGLVKE